MPEEVIVSDVIEKYFSIHSESVQNEMKKLFSFAMIRSFQKGSHVSFVEDEVRFLDFVLSGKVKGYLHSDVFVEKVVAVFHPGYFLNISDAYSGRFYINFIAVEDCELLSIPASDVISLSETSAPIAHFFAKCLADMIKHGYVDMSVKRTDLRLLLYFKFLITTFGYEVRNNRVEIPRSRSITDISAMLMTTRETVSRLLPKMKGDGVLDYSENLFIIPDYRAFCELTDSYELPVGFFGSE